MRKVFYILILIPAWIYSQTFSTNFSEYYSVGISAQSPPDTPYVWGQNYHVAGQVGFDKTDSIYYKGHTFLYLRTNSTWRTNLRWFYRALLDTIPLTSTPQLYAEFGFYQAGISNATFGIVLKNNVVKDSIHGYVLEVIDRTTGADSIRIMKYTNNVTDLSYVGTKIASASLSFTFNHIFSDSVLPSMYCLRAQMVSDTIKGKVWKRTNAEPSTWNIIYYDTTYKNQLGYAGELTNIGWVVYVDSLSVVTTPPPLPYTLQINEPSQPYTLGNRFSDWKITWSKSSNIDTVGVYLGNHLIGMTTDTAFVIIQDTLNHYSDSLAVDTLKVSVKAFTRTLSGITYNPPISVPPADSAHITGSGTKNDPYVIYSAEQYVEYIHRTGLPIYKYIKMGNNWDFKNIPITDQIAYDIHERAWFTVVDGQGFTIKNFHVIRDSTQYFASFGSYAIFRTVYQIKNITVDSSSIILNKPIPFPYEQYSPGRYRSSSPYFVQDAWSNGRQINLLVNRIDGSYASQNFGPSYEYAGMGIDENIKIKNCSIWIDLSNIYPDWIHTSIGCFSSNKGAFATPGYILKRCFVDNVNIYVKLDSLKKSCTISGLVTSCWGLEDSYFNGNITFNIITPIAGEEDQTGVGVYGIVGFTETSIKNCYSRGTITEQGHTSFKSLGLIASRNTSPGLANIDVDTVRNNIVVFNDRYYVNNSLLAHFKHFSGLIYNDNVLDFATIINCYSTMKAITADSIFAYGGFLAIKAYARRLFQDARDSTLLRNTMTKLVTDYLDSNFVLDLRDSPINTNYNTLRTYNGYYLDGARGCYYDIDSCTNIIHSIHVNWESKYGRSTSQMKTKSTYQNWAFDENTGWRFNPSKNDGYPNLYLDSLYTFTYNIVASDSTYIITPPLYRNGTLRIISHTPTTFNFDYSDSQVVNISVESSGIDSIKTYLGYSNPSSDTNWIYLEKRYITHSILSFTDTTNYQITARLIRGFKNIIIKVTEDVDTTTHGLTANELGKVALTSSRQLCYYWGRFGVGIFESNRDVSCAWNPSYHQRERRFMKISLNAALDSVITTTWGYYIDYDKTLISVQTGDFGFADSVSVDSSAVALRIDKITSQQYIGTAPLYYLSRGYYFKKINSDSSYLMMQDLRNNLSYPIYTVKKGIGFYTFSTESMNLDYTFDQTALLLYNFLPARGGRFGGYIGLQQSHYPMINQAVPNGVVLPLLGFPNPSGIASDLVSLTGINGGNYKSDKFRGIHPKIWKYGNINGVKP